MLIFSYADGSTIGIPIKYPTSDANKGKDKKSNKSSKSGKSGK